jgi:uncharacterized alkaline shock family protein YloU
MNDLTRTPGKTTIAPDVLISIAKLTTLSIPGVRKLSEQPADVSSIFSSHRSEGVKIEVENNTVYTDLFLVLDGNVNVRDVCRKVQEQVSRAISEMVGMDVGRVNVHVENIVYSSDEDKTI